MNNIHSMPSNQHLYDQASDWIVKMDRGLSADEKIALREWLQSDTENHDILMEMTQLWDKMDAMTRLSDLFAKPSVPTEASRANSQGYRSYLAIAASTVIVAMAGLWTLFGAVDNGNYYQTAIGEQSTVMLQDGTQLILNTNTQVSVSYSDQQRLLTLKQGELHVSVAKDKYRPLSVIAGGQIVQALGTEFNVEITDDQKIELVVTEGKVKIGLVKASVQQAVEKAQPKQKSLRLPVDAPIVSAGEEIMLGDPNETITEVSADDIAVKLSWQQGNLIFRGESLEEAVKEINRYTSVEFVFMSEDLKKMRVAGLFKAGDVEGLLATLRENFDIVSQRDGDGKVLLSEEE